LRKVMGENGVGVRGDGLVAVKVDAAVGVGCAGLVADAAAAVVILAHDLLCGEGAASG